MKPSLIVLLLIGLLSCNKVDPFLPLTPELIEEIHTYDLDNNGNSSDIRMSFIVKDNLNVGEYRIMFVPTSVSELFDEEVAANVPPGNYFEVLPESFQNEYPFNRLPAGLLDVNGNPIQNETEYLAVVLVIGTGNIQLSSFFLPFILKNVPKYSGLYWIGRDLICDAYLGQTDHPPEEPDARSFIDLVSADGNSYSGIKIFQQSERGLVSLSVKGESIFNYLHENPDHPCNPTYPLLTGEACNVDPCAFLEQGAGNIIDELILELNITSQDCQEICGGKRIYARQG